MVVKVFTTFCFSSFLLIALVSPLAVDAAPKEPTGNDSILKWNAIALQAVADDHSFGAPEQGGPTRTSRALAIVHIAMYDALNAIDGSHDPYIPVGLSASITNKAAIDAAVAQAARDTLVALYPSQAAVFNRELQLALNGVPEKKGRGEGVTVGKKAASNILADRVGDGKANEDTAILGHPMTTGLPGEHMADPLNPGQGLLTRGWGAVRTFSGFNPASVAFRTPPFYALTSPDYTANFIDVKSLGGDGIVTPTVRTAEQTDIGLFWAYDGSIDIGVPPRFYNQIARVIAKQEGNTVVENARLFALINIALADAGIAAWESKYYHNIWRPIVAIRNADLDGNPDTVRDASWTPLGAPASNQSGNNFTPPFPAYPSGHAAFGAAMFRTLINFYASDNVPFRLKSDELSGRTTDNQGNHRNTVVRRFDHFSDAALENARSRIYLGIHWQLDADEGVIQGVKVADEVFDNLLAPTP